MASPGPADNTNELQITDLAEVLQLLRRHGYSGTSYYNLGLYLGLSPATLDVIKENNKDNVESCLRECLNRWLQKADDVQKKGGPTIYSLVSALRELRENGVADGIDMDKHPACRILAHYTSNQSLVSALPQMAALLCSENIIEETMLLATNVQGEALLIQIKEAICKDYRKLQAFAVTLCKLKVTVEIGNDIMKEYREFFNSDDLVVMNDDNGLKIYLPQSMTSGFMTMRLKFGLTFLKVEKLIKESPPAHEDIKNMLSYSSDVLESQVAHRGDINGILKFIRDKCSLNDISMLEFFVLALNIQKAESVIQEYSQAITDFSKTKLSQCLHEKFSYASPLQCERITIVVDRKTDDCTLDDVRRLSAEIFVELLRHVKLNVVKDGDSFTITCSFPLILSEQLITAALNNIDVLKENKVKRLIIGYCTVYENNDTSTSTTYKHQYISSLSTSSGLSKQLMLLRTVQLINSKEEVEDTLNEELKTKMPHLKKKENEISRQKLDETGQLSQKKDEASNVAKKLLPVTKQLPSVESTQEISVYNVISSEPQAVSTVHLENNTGLKQSLVSEEQEKPSPTSEETEAKIHDLSKKLDEKNAEIEKLQDKKDAEIEKLRLEKDAEIEKLRVEKDAEIEKLRVEKDAEIKKLRGEKKAEIEKLQLKLNSKVQDFEKQDHRLEDDIYDLIIEIDHPLLKKIVRTEQFTRLKNIKKLGYTYYNMPRATCSRYEQSIGMYYFAGKFVKTLRTKQPELNITDTDVLCVQIAALCYNLGFGPFSHIFSDFLKEIKASHRYWKDLPPNVMMFEHMIKVNRLPFEKYLDNPEQDIEFIKELMTGKQGAQAALREDKVFLYEIVANRMSGLDVNRMDYTMRDAVVLGSGKKINFQWRTFLNKIRVEVCPDKKKHICAFEEDLDTYNEFFADRHTLFKKLYFERQNRNVATMINRILMKCGETELIRGPDGKRLSLVNRGGSRIEFLGGH